MRLIQRCPYWVKSGLILGILVSAMMFIFPDQFSSDIDLAPWYLQVLMLPALIIFSLLCMTLTVDFVSNFHPDEGMYRQILIPLFSAISFFITAFIIGSLIALIVGFIIKKVKANK